MMTGADISRLLLLIAREIGADAESLDDEPVVAMIAGWRAVIRELLDDD